MTDNPPKLLDQVRDRIRVKHYSKRTELAYVGWIKRFIFFNGKRHPKDMGALEVEAYLTHLAVDGKVSASTQTQALSALLFLYKEVLKIELPWLDNVIRAKKPQRLPTVLTSAEVKSVLAHLDGTRWLMASLLYGTGMRLMECLRLRVKDVDFAMREIRVRDGKGMKDRVTMLPDSVIGPLQAHLEKVKRVHEADLAAGFGEVWLPFALDRKYPNAGKEWGWQYVFPSTQRSIDPQSGKERRHHLDEKVLQRAVSLAAKAAGMVKPTSCHTLRHYAEFRTMPTKAVHARESKQPPLFQERMHAGVSA